MQTDELFPEHHRGDWILMSSHFGSHVDAPSKFSKMESLWANFQSISLALERLRRMSGGVQASTKIR